MFKRIVKRIQEEPVVFLSKKLWKFAAGDKRKIVLYLILSFLGRVVWLLPPVVFAKLLNSIQISGVTSSNISFLLILVGLLFLLDFLGWSFHGPSRILENIVAFKVDKNYKKYLYNAVLSLPLSWHTDHDSGNTIDKVNKATDAIFEFSRHIFLIVSVLVSFFGTTIILGLYSIYLAAIADIILFLAFIAIFKYDLKIVPLNKEKNRLENISGAKVFDVISNITTVKVLSIEKSVLASIKTSIWAPFEVYKKNKLLVELKWFVGGMFFTCIVVFPLGGYIFYLYKNNLVVEVGTISLLYSYLTNLNQIYYSFTDMYGDMMTNKTRLQNAEDIEREYENMRVHKKKNFENFETLNFSNTNFSYDNKKVIDNLNLSLKKGERVAIIGESGSGKSTLLKVIHGMYENTYADILVESTSKKIDLKHFDLAKADFASTLVPQEPEVFSASIKENLTLLIDFSNAEILKSTDAACFTDVIENLPQKIDSVVNEKGVNLSGGQKQRLALSRALLFSKNKNLILLDESTSSVDPVNEVKIYQNIFNDFKNATILASIHKMNLLKYFDRILIMKDGKISDQGTFDQLLETNTEFKNSWEEYIKNNHEV